MFISMTYTKTKDWAQIPMKKLFIATYSNHFLDVNAKKKCLHIAVLMENFKLNFTLTTKKR